MCLITDQKEPKVAEEDIVVYKILQGKCAPFNEFTYKIGELYKTEIKEDFGAKCPFDTSDRLTLDKAYGEDWSDNDDIKSFGPGFHSSLSIDRLKLSTTSSLYNAIIHECIIPKGSEYYTNPSGLAVSNQIIIKQEVYFELPDNQG